MRRGGTATDMQGRDEFPPPFRIIDEIYYVGSRKVRSHLVTSDKGHVLTDTYNVGGGPSVLKSI